MRARNPAFLRDAWSLMWHDLLLRSGIEIGHQWRRYSYLTHAESRALNDCDPLLLPYRPEPSEKGHAHRREMYLGALEQCAKMDERACEQIARAASPTVAVAHARLRQVGVVALALLT